MQYPKNLVRGLALASWLGLHFVTAKGPISETCTASQSAIPSSTCVYKGAPSKPTGTAPPLFRPTAGTTWDVILTHNDGDVIHPSPNFTVYDVDITDPNIPAIKAYSPNDSCEAKKLICYFSAGTAEDFRSDIGCFHAADLGCNYGGDFANEQWVDYTSPNVRAIMLHRMDRARALGCDAIDPDNLDAYANNNGLGLTLQDSIDYMRFLSREAHARGLSIGLKNAPDLVPYLSSGADADVVQFAVVEECIAQGQCDLYDALAAQGKPIFSIEYRSDAQGNPLEGAKNSNKNWSLPEQKAICAKWAAIKKGSGGEKPELLSTVLKHYPDLDGYFVRTCPNVYA